MFSGLPGLSPLIAIGPPPPGVTAKNVSRPCLIDPGVEGTVGAG